jgi:alkanesulfonate monooxygenase SsuD/methylene tetrahydromethanopterin reductase-like flavin-dependent oxidoreductase (luciferase family)
VLIGGTGPKTLALAGEIADGVILDSQFTVATLRDAVGHTSRRVDPTVARHLSAQCCSWNAARIRSPQRPARILI